MTLVANPFCTEAELVRRFGEGVRNWADHDEDGTGDTGVVDDAINQATEEIFLFAGKRYTAVRLAASKLINGWAITLAGFFLSQSRGNSPPESLEAEFVRIMARLERVGSGADSLPGVPMRADLRPTMSNLQVDRRFLHSKTRVTRTNSSDAPTTMTQDASPDYPLGE